MRRIIWIGLVCVVGALGLALVSDVGPARGAGSQPRYLTFIDTDNALSFRLQVEPAAPGAGAFSFRLPTGQVYVGTVAGAMQVHSPSSITIQYAGPATLYPSPADLNSTPLTTAQIALQGQVNPNQKTAQITLDAGGQQYHLVVRGRRAAPGLTGTLAVFEQASRQGDWASLYGLLMRDTTAGTSQATFVAQMAQATNTLGPITRVQRLNTPQVDVTDLGFTTAWAAYAIERTPPGGAAVTKTYDVTFILEGTTWKLWYMDAR
jgi:hypothetical protein